MKLLQIQYAYPKKEYQQTRKFLLKKNQQTNKLYLKIHKIYIRKKEKTITS
jgi:hypothetical protein